MSLKTTLRSLEPRSSLLMTFGDPVHASVTKQVENWNKSNFCSATSQSRRQRSTLDASSAFVEP